MEGFLNAAQAPSARRTAGSIAEIAGCAITGAISAMNVAGNEVLIIGSNFKESCTPIDLRVAVGNHQLLNIGAPQKQLSHCAVVPIFGDPSDSNPSPRHHVVEIVASSFRRNWVGVPTPKFSTVNAGQPDLLSSGGGPGGVRSATRPCAVVPVGIHEAWRSQQPVHQTV